MRFSLPVRYLLFPAVCLNLLFLNSVGRGDDSANLLTGNFDIGPLTYNPWAGVDTQGNLRGLNGAQLSVSAGGSIISTPFSPSVAVGDLNGDGLPDLIAADSRGFFWFYPNSGTPAAPVFTHGEIMPIWLGAEIYMRDVVPRIQLVDFDGDGKLDLVVGTFDGVLYYLHNRGSATAPDFHMASDLTSMQVATRSDKRLWCNYLAPFLYDWSGTGRLDLLFGDGTYASNSIYLLANQGNNARPVFSEKMMSKTIPGMGREHLTPVVIDWNNDGKPDIIAGERQGFVNLYLNQAASKTAPPVFDKDNPQHVMFGNVAQLGYFATVGVGDLNNDKLFDLVIGKPDGRMYVALNTGTLGSPKFDVAVPLKGTNPYPKVMLPQQWRIDAYHPYGAANQVLELVNAQIEPTFAPPPDFNGKGAMKFSVMTPKNQYFNQTFTAVPTNDPHDTKHTITYLYDLKLTTDVRYQFSFWNRGNDVSNLTWTLQTTQRNAKDEAFKLLLESDAISVGDTWSKASQTFKLDSLTEKKNDENAFSLTVSWEGEGSVYFDDFSLTKAN